jgi:hypothetical protein
VGAHLLNYTKQEVCYRTSIAINRNKRSTTRAHCNDRIHIYVDTATHSTQMSAHTQTLLVAIICMAYYPARTPAAECEEGRYFNGTTCEECPIAAYCPDPATHTGPCPASTYCPMKYVALEEGATCPAGTTLYDVSYVSEPVLFPPIPPNDFIFEVKNQPYGNGVYEIGGEYKRRIPSIYLKDLFTKGEGMVWLSHYDFDGFGYYSGSKYPVGDDYRAHETLTIKLPQSYEMRHYMLSKFSFKATSGYPRTFRLYGKRYMQDAAYELIIDITNLQYSQTVIFEHTTFKPHAYEYLLLAVQKSSYNRVGLIDLFVHMRKVTFTANPDLSNHMGRAVCMYNHPPPSIVTCPKGYYANETATCVPCPPTSTCYGTGDPIPCQPGFLCPSPETTIPCPAAYYCVNGTSQLPCDNVTEYCPPKSVAPVKCTNGSYSLESSTPCRTIPLGYTYDTGATALRQCTTGAFCAGATAGEVRCTAGYYCPNGSHYSMCPAGYICNGTDSMTVCPINMSCPKGAVAPQQPLSKQAIEFNTSIDLTIDINPSEIDYTELAKILEKKLGMPNGTIKIISIEITTARRRLLAYNVRVKFTLANLSDGCVGAPCGIHCSQQQCETALSLRMQELSTSEPIELPKPTQKPAKSISIWVYIGAASAGACLVGAAIYTYMYMTRAKTKMPSISEFLKQRGENKQ